MRLEARPKAPSVGGRFLFGSGLSGLGRIACGLIFHLRRDLAVLKVKGIFSLGKRKFRFAV